MPYLLLPIGLFASHLSHSYMALAPRSLVSQNVAHV